MATEPEKTINPSDVVINTLQDDLRKQTGKPPLKDKVSPKRTQSTGPSLPPASELDEKDGLQQPVRKKKTNIAKIIVTITVTLLVVVMLGIGTWWAVARWSTGGGQQATGPTLSPGEIIPSSAEIVLQYNMQLPEEKEAIQKVWESANIGTTTAGISAIADGDPRALLGDSETVEFFYVLLPNETRPYAVVRKTEYIQNIVEEQSFVQAIEKNGWYIIHSISTDPYEIALSGGVMGENMPEGDGSFVMRAIMSAGYVAEVYGDIAGTQFVPKEPKAAIVRISSMSNDGALHMSGEIRGSTPSADALSKEINKDMYAMIPKDVSFMLFGNTFSSDFVKWQKEITTTDTATTPPQIQQFIESLTESYTFYRRKGPDGTEDIGLIITLPSELQKVLKVGDEAVEDALQEILPFIIGRAGQSELVFNEAEYKEIPVRYMNISGQTKAIDYTVGDNYILISSSREGMQTIIDTLLGEEKSFEESSPWQGVLERGEAVLSGTNIIMGTTNHPSLTQILPISNTTKNIPIGFGSEKTMAGTIIQGVLLLDSIGE